MATATTSLQEMGLFLIRSLDARKNLISNILQTSDGATIQYKSGSTAPIKVAVQLNATLFCDGYVIIRNSKENVQTIIDNWDASLKFPELVLIFLDDKTGDKWLLRPSVHVKVAEPKTLAAGLMTLFEHSIGKPK